MRDVNDTTTPETMDESRDMHLAALSLLASVNLGPATGIAYANTTLSPATLLTSGNITENMDVQTACKIFQLRSRATAGEDPLEQAAAGRSAVVAAMMHVEPKTVRDLWNRTVGAEATRALWTEHECHLSSCDQFRTAAGIATTANRKSGPATKACLASRAPRRAALPESTSPHLGKRARADGL